MTNGKYKEFMFIFLYNDFVYILICMEANFKTYKLIIYKDMDIYQ